MFIGGFYCAQIHKDHYISKYQMRKGAVNKVKETAHDYRPKVFTFWASGLNSANLI
jgi:hypothetical protein